MGVESRELCTTNFPLVPVFDLRLVNPGRQLRLRKFLERSRKRGRTRHIILPGSDTRKPYLDIG